MDITRRALIGGIATLTTGAGTAGGAASAAVAAPARTFPAGFRWGAATSGHQTEGNNTNSDTWAVEQIKPTLFAEASGDAADSFHRWPLDLDIARSLHLDTYRFSLEWSRIEPERGQFSVAMLDHYKAMVDGCVARGLEPVVTFSHFSSPRWFAMIGGWSNARAPELFERFCGRAARHLAGALAAAITLNEPNLMRLLRWKLPPQVFANNDAVMASAAMAYGSKTFVAQFIESASQTEAMQPILMEANRRARRAIKAVRPNLPVGVSLAMEDDQAVGPDSRLTEKRAYCYDPWLKLAQDDDFIGVQNYERARIDRNGQMPPPDGAPKSTLGAEIYPLSLAGAVRYAWQRARVPILVSEHGIGTADDEQRAALIPAALAGLHSVIGEGVPVLGYIHWSLLDNFEWVFGYGPRFGLCTLDRTNFKRTPKPSAAVLADIARRHAL